MNVTMNQKENVTNRRIKLESTLRVNLEKGFKGCR